ncbi:phage terminase small subunit P27 family [Paracoccus alkanivorans]|uniref:Phage terminase small subunit P27 family n=1 Tax=Paracoccus alkanivorans TaxID=2116655 RepID=A0A3M0MI32_9RHOB|nr:phage terminase small subunit P27 family [Paracoccus alkanivorans]RMC35360.1 phage terminase small subunit P27 family [Paracoccus alkanivorans]
MKGTKPALVVDNMSYRHNIPAPDWLAKDARAEWDRVMPVLTERRILTDADLGGLENYCICIGRVRETEALIQDGQEPDMMLKLARLQDKAMASARQLAAELGLTPVSRSRPAIREDGDNEPDPLDI